MFGSEPRSSRRRCLGASVIASGAPYRVDMRRPWLEWSRQRFLWTGLAAWTILLAARILLLPLASSTVMRSIICVCGCEVGRRSPQRITVWARAGRVMTADGGIRWFAGVLSAGFDAIVNERANRMGWPRGPFRYTLAMVWELLWFRAITYRLVIDGVRSE